MLQDHQVILMPSTNERNQRKSTEVLHNNRLEKDVQRIFRPLNFMLIVLLTPKFKIQSDHVNPIGRIRIGIWYLIVVFMLSASLFRIFFIDFDGHYFKESIMISTLNISYAIFLYVGYTIMFIIELVNRQYHCFLIVMFQVIHESIDFSERVRSFVTWNWISVLTVFSFNFLFLSFFYWSQDVIDPVDLISDLTYVSYDINIVYAIRVLLLLTKYLDEWIKCTLRLNDEQENATKLFETYYNIMKTFNLYKKLFQLLVLYYSVDTFFRTLLYWETTLQMLEMGRNAQETFTMSIMVLLYLMKNMTLFVILNIYCEKFYMTVEEAETACIQLVKNSNCPKTQKHLCKKVLQMNRTCSRMTACGLFCVDAALPVCLMGLISNSLIVLLQFALL